MRLCVSKFLSFLIMKNQQDFDGVMRRRTEVDDEGQESATIEEIDNFEPTNSPTNAPLAERLNDGEEGEPRCFEEVEVQEMIEFFHSIDYSSFDVDKKNAVEIILDKIENDNASSNPEPAADFFAKNKSKIHKEMHAILVSFVPAGERLSRFGNAYLKKWMMASNLKRYFLYRSKEALATIAANRFLKRIERVNSQTYDNLVDILVELGQQERADNNSDDSDNPPAPNNTTADTQNNGRRGQRSNNNPTTQPVLDEVIQAVMKKSFMKHLKGEAREHCQLGHKLELPIGRDFMRLVNEKNKLGRVRIISLHKVGIVSKKNCPWSKDSIDFIACILDEDETLQLWGVEIKSRQTTSTITEEKEYMRRLRRNKFDKINSTDAAKFIRKRDERFQLLHHAYVYDFAKVVHVVGDNSGKVINATIVDYDPSLLSAYGDVITTLKDEVLFWAYDDTTDASDIVIPQNIVDICVELPNVNCVEALYSTVKLWKRMFHDTDILPLPSLQRIIPRSHAKWNAGKPGSDTITKIVDDCVFTPPKLYTNFESRASGRCFSNLCASILRLFQIASSNHQNFENKYPTLRHYLDAASHRFTYKKVLRILYSNFKEEVKKLSAAGTNNGQMQPSATPSSQQVTFNGQTVSDKLDFASVKTFKTPKKAKKRMIEKGTKISKLVQDRINSCSGHPFEVVDQGLNTKDQRRECLICKNKTKWMCVKCRFYFCMDYKETQKRKKQFYFVKEKKDEKSQDEITKIYGKTCFHIGHEKTLRQMLMCHPAVNEEQENTNPNIVN